MRSTACIATAVFLLLFPAGALGQGAGQPGAPPSPGGSPLGPLSPTDPSPPAPEEPEPVQPVQPVDDDDELGGIESIALAGVALLLIAAVGVGISREGRKLGARAGRKRRRRRSVRAGQGRTRGQPAAPGGVPAGRRDGAKAPPPPPRKRRAKAKRR
jgi:hypothetical protein